jgi:Conjugative transposon protein TcpC
MSAAEHRPRVAVAARPMWRLRLARELPRHLLHALATMGVLASARYAVDPPRPTLPLALLRRPVPADPAAQGFATLFARRYLTWEARDPQGREDALAPYDGSGIEAGAGLQPPPGSEQSVQWAQVVQEREPRSGEHVYTVAAQTDAAGLLYLTVSVVRTPAGGLALGGYPAFVGAPATSAAAPESSGMPEVDEPALRAVVERALRNYLAGSASELAADLSRGARVSMPGIALALGALQSLRWAPGSGAVLAVLQARDGRGAQYTLAYELDVAREQGRWEVSAIQMDPDA